MADQIDSLLQQAITAAHAGQRDEARQLLLRVLNERPRSELAWLWMSTVVDEPDERAFCLRRMLAIRPNSKYAFKGLQELGEIPTADPPHQQAAPLALKGAPVSAQAAPPAAITSAPVERAMRPPARQINHSAAEMQQLTAFGRFRLHTQADWRRFRDSWRIFARNRLALFGVALIVIFGIMAVAEPVLLGSVWPKGIYNPETGYDMTITQHPSPPSLRHIFGTDTLGRDVLSMLLSAATPTFLLALVAALSTAAISTTVGALAAYFRGPVDAVSAHVADLALLAPAPLVLVVVSGLTYIGPVQFGLLYGLISGLGGAAIVMRAHALTLMNRPFIDASRVAGGGPLHIITQHLVPHMLPLAAVHMLLSVVGAVFADGFTSFLGLSRVRLNWGSMIYTSFTNRAVNSAITWNVLLPPALAISLFAASFYFIARGLHEVAEPRLASGDLSPCRALTETVPNQLVRMRAQRADCIARQLKACPELT